MGVLEIISALAALAAIASSVYAGVETSKATGRAEGYAEEQQKFSEQEMKRRNAASRRSAMERALAGKPSKAYHDRMGPKAPAPYDPTLANTIGSVAGGVQQLANADWSGVSKKLGSYQYPWNRTQQTITV